MLTTDRLACAQSFILQLHDWQAALPPHLGAVRPSSLVPIFCRQATALKLAYCHAIMHTTRPFLLDHSEEPSPEMRACVKECIGAAKLALLTVDQLYSERAASVHALWWMPYVTFCALAVTYVWEIQQQTNNSRNDKDASLFSLAERCQNHLAETTLSNSASRRYSIIIEELRQEAAHSTSQAFIQSQTESHSEEETAGGNIGTQQPTSLINNNTGPVFNNQEVSSYIFQYLHNPPSQWQPNDWLNLDSSVSTELLIYYYYLLNFSIRHLGFFLNLQIIFYTGGRAAYRRLR